MRCRAGKRLRADMMKSCHHGAADVTDEFIRAVDPFAYVVSSGDEESHAHPRPDLLGRLGNSGAPRRRSSFAPSCCARRASAAADKFRALRKLDKVIEDPDTAETDRAAAKKDKSSCWSKSNAAMSASTGRSPCVPTASAWKSRSGSKAARQAELAALRHARTRRWAGWRCNSEDGLDDQACAPMVAQQS